MYVRMLGTHGMGLYVCRYAGMQLWSYVLLLDSLYGLFGPELCLPTNNNERGEGKCDQCDIVILQSEDVAVRV